MRLLTIFFFGLLSFNLCAQSIQNLVTHIAFDNSDCHVEDQAGDTSIGIFEAGDTTCGCGLVGNSRFFDGDEDWFYLYGDKIEDAFSTKDLTVSFYFKPVSGGTANQALISKKVDCTGPEAFAIRYNPITRSINVELAEMPTISASLSKIPSFACWYHVVVIRKGGMTQLYVNNVKLGEATSPGNIRVDLRNTATLTVGSSDCNTEDQFHGYIDELRIYSRAISLQDIEDLYLWPNQILTGLKPTGINDEDIFLGESVSISVNESCATSFTWSPANNVADPDEPEPILSPTETTTYKLTMVDADNCTYSDSIRIIVHDVNSIQCGEILLPAAFTPNGEGPLDNEQFGISNIFAVGELRSFEIFDRWGNLVFTTNDVRGTWDGTYKGLPVNPGVFLYKITYRCEGTENVKSGSVTVIR